MYQKSPPSLIPRTSAAQQHLGAVGNAESQAPHQTLNQNLHVSKMLKEYMCLSRFEKP